MFFFKNQEVIFLDPDNGILKNKNKNSLKHILIDEINRYLIEKKIVIFTQFQSYNTNNNMISDITNKNPENFLEKEIRIRKINNLPPFQRFISLILTGDNENKLEKEALRFKLFLENKISGKILGPVNAPIFRLKRKYRVRLLIRGLKTLKLQNSLAKLIPKYKFTSGIKLSVDVDPISFN